MTCCTTVTLLLLGLSLSCCSKFPPREYYYVNINMSWPDAQQYCREKYTDLATFESMDDISRLKPAFSYSWAWIGLKDDPKSWKGTVGNDSNSWRWSTTGEPAKTAYHSWGYGDPNSGKGNENCVALGSDGLWADMPCSFTRPFVCYSVTEDNQKTYVFISTRKTWSSAQEYCRTRHTDLAMIENEAENTEVKSAKSDTGDAWIGLSRVPWTWADKSQSLFRNWRAGEPNNGGLNEFCVAETNQHLWTDHNCKNKYVFICHQVSKLRTTVKMVMVTDTDISDPAAHAQILQQLEDRLRSQGWTDFKLRWKTPPRKQEEGVCTAEARCN